MASRIALSLEHTQALAAHKEAMAAAEAKHNDALAMR